MNPIFKHIWEAKTATPEQYKNSSIIRFGRLDTYIQEKLLVDYFAIKGNLGIAKGLREYIKRNLETLQKKDSIRLLDGGPAIGAISTMLALQALNEFGLMEKTYVHLVDVSERVIEQTQRCNFFFPTCLVNPNLKGRIFKKLRHSKGCIESVEKLSFKDNRFDIALAGFLFHHLHDSIKPIAAKEITRVLAPGGFLGIAEEWFKNYEKDYAARHKDDEVSLAFESIISYKKLAKMLPEVKVFYKHNTNYRESAYAFCGEKIQKI